ncbi:MAG: S8 family serine peptidase [bacterium]|nr:S8 family serine peptidase [bacterium]
MKINLSEYVILRTPAVSGTDHEKLRPRTKGVGKSGPTAGKIGIELDTAKLSKKEIKDLPRDPNISLAVPIMPMKLHEPVTKESVQSAEEVNATWGVKAVGADMCPYTGKGIKVAVLDTGIDAKHPAFKNVELVQKDFTGEGNGDDNGHGTHVAGTIFGQTVNGLRIGVSPGIDQALVGKVLDAEGGGSTKSIALWPSNGP